MMQTTITIAGAVVTAIAEKSCSVNLMVKMQPG